MINFFIKTYGCQANVADSQAVANYLKSLECIQVFSESEADIILINTCAIRDKAEQKFFSYLGQLALLKVNKKHMIVGIIGCVATYKQKEILNRYDFVSFVFGAKGDFTRIKEILLNIVSSLDNNLNNNNLDKKQSSCDIVLGGFKNTEQEFKQSFINIMTGCNNYCSYCIVPFTRGREKSYSASAILDRIKKDVENGASEIFLLGQNVNSYLDPDSGINFAQLLKKVGHLEGDFWVRFISPHPKDMTKEVLYVMAQNPDKLCAYVHHPLQSGSNNILKAMNRTYTVEQYMEQIGWIREILPDATISTDVIVGFPGETETDYIQTRDIVDQIKFDNLYSFIYSPRKYTAAALLKDDCSKDIKLKRLDDLQQRNHIIAKERNLLNIGKSLKCLVEKRLTNDKLLARTAGNVRVCFEGSDCLVNRFVKIKIEQAGSVNLYGSLIDKS